MGAGGAPGYDRRMTGAPQPSPEVLFVCVHNAGRSQMAAGFARALGGGAMRVRSAGSTPASQINPLAAQAMAEVGIDIVEAVPMRLDPAAVAAADVVVTMGCGDECPVLPGRRYLDWALDDPEGRPLGAVRAIRDEIAERVRALLGELGVNPLDGP